MTSGDIEGYNTRQRDDQMPTIVRHIILRSYRCAILQELALLSRDFVLRFSLGACDCYDIRSTLGFT